MLLKYSLLNMFKSKGKYKPIPKHIVDAYMKTRNNKKNNVICLAPFNSLRINRTGGITPCCQNFNLDNIKNKSLLQVWNGVQFKKLRNYIKKNDLSFFCDFCKVHLINGNHGSVLARTYDFYPVNKNGFPSYIDFSMYNTCNLACIMCNPSLSSQKNGHKDVLNNTDFKYDDNFFEDLKIFIPHLKAVNFSGGEPFLISDYYKIWDIMAVLNPDLPISVTTNGTVLNDKVISYLNKLKFNIRLSIDSINKETYEEIRINAHFENLIEHIDFFSNYCKGQKTSFSVVVCPIRMNIYEIPDLIEYGNKNSFNVDFNIVTKPYNCAIWTMPPDDIARICEYLKTFRFPENNAIEINNNKNYNNIIELLKTWLAHAILREKDFPNANFEILKNDFKRILINKAEFYYNSLTEDKKSNFFYPHYIVNVEYIINNLPIKLLLTNLNSRIENLPNKFLFEEIYFQSPETSLDNLCSLAYYSI